MPISIQQKLQSKLFKANTEMYLNKLIQSKSTFELLKSNYSAKFTDGKKVLKKILTENRGNTVFIFANKIKKELDNNPIKINKVEREYLQYFNFNKKLLESGNVKINKIVNIDLKSAYLNALKNEGLISNLLFSEIGKLKKVDRLVCIGLLAYEPDLYIYEKGINVSYEKIKNEYANYFFFAVKRVHEIIMNLKFLLGESFIFSWVDGVYFYENPIAEKKIIQYLNNIDYNYTREYLFNFETLFIDGNSNIKFEKGKDKKEFNIPTDCNAELIINNLIFKKQTLKSDDYSRNIKIS